MTAFLASVRDAAEALIALDGGAEIIDAKEPRDGALGAVPLAGLTEIVTAVDGRRLVSTTVGDLPMQPRIIANAVAERARAGADYIKFGVFEAEAAYACAEAAVRAAGAARIVAVLFADLPDVMALANSAALRQFAEAGAHGVMLDTADKSRGGLLAHAPVSRLAAIVADAHAAGLKCGLAGALAINDIEEMTPLQPDFLGFRGALCAQGRNGAIDAGLVKSAAGLIKTNKGG
jgi:dihydroneopterin aldolase